MSAIAAELHCDMKEGCEEPVTHVDNRGFVYCSQHAERRKSGGTPTRALRPNEIKNLERGETIRYRRSRPSGP